MCTQWTPMRKQHSSLHVWYEHETGSGALSEALCVYASVCVYIHVDAAHTVIRWSASSFSCVFSLLCFVPFLNYSRALLRERVTCSPLPQQHPIKAAHPNAYPLPLCRIQLKMGRDQKDARSLTRVMFFWEMQICVIDGRPVWKSLWDKE